MKSSIAYSLCVAAACALPASAMAQQTSEEDELALVYGDKTSVSIATGSVQSLRRAPAVASVITAADIAAMGATDLDQVLETVPGMHVNRSANNYAPLYVMRGIATQFGPQLLVLQDGVPITTIFTGNKGNLWGGYPVEHIARIEIIRGPGSALYGADAYAGVINIITKNASDIGRTEAGVQTGSFATRDGWVQHGGHLGGLEVAAFVRVGKSAGFDSVIAADAQTRNDGLAGTHASLAPGQVNVGYDAVDANLALSYGKWRLRAGYKLRDKLGTGAGISSALDPVGQQKSERITSTLAWADPQFGADWSVGASISTMQYVQLTPVDYQLFPPGLQFPTGAFPNGMIGGPDTWERQVRASAYATYLGLAGHQMRLGLGHDDLNLYRTRETRNFTYTSSGLPVPLPGVVDFSSTNPFMFPQRRKVDYLYLQDEWLLAADWTMTAGVRHDQYSDFGGTTNPRLAVVWDASLDLTVKFLYGRAFRAPAFNESYGITNPVALGNPNLRPETNGTLETALSWQARDDLQVNATVYRYAMNNIIRTVPNAIAGTGATYANTGGQHGRGIEIESTWNATRDLRLQANFALQRATDDKTGKDAGYAPHRHLYASANWQFASGYLLSGQLNHVAKRERAPGDARARVPDYTTFDLSAGTRRGSGKWDWTVAVRNLFNADVREPSLAPGLALPLDLPMAPRSLSLQASIGL